MSFLLLPLLSDIFNNPSRPSLSKPASGNVNISWNATSRKIFCSPMNKIDSVTLSLGEDVSQFPTSFLRNATLIQSEYLFTFENTFIWNFYIISIWCIFFEKSHTIILNQNKQSVPRKCISWDRFGKFSMIPRCFYNMV